MAASKVGQDTFALVGSEVTLVKGESSKLTISCANGGEKGRSKIVFMSFGQDLQF